MFTFTDVCACEIRRREVTEACRCACPDGIAPSKVSTSNDACDDHFLISAKSETLLSRPLSASMYTNFAKLKVSDSKVWNFGLGQACCRLSGCEHVLLNTDRMIVQCHCDPCYLLEFDSSAFLCVT